VNSFLIEWVEGGGAVSRIYCSHTTCSELDCYIYILSRKMEVLFMLINYILSINFHYQMSRHYMHLP